METMKKIAQGVVGVEILGCFIASAYCFRTAYKRNPELTKTYLKDIFTGAALR